MAAAPAARRASGGHCASIRLRKLNDVLESEIRAHSLRARAVFSATSAGGIRCSRRGSRSAIWSRRSRRATRAPAAGSKFATASIRSGAGQHPKPDITLSFKNATIGASLLTPPINWLNQINAQKDFTLGVDGPEDLTNWFAQTLMMMQTAHWKFGTPMPDGSMRYCNMANGGPLFVYVKDGKIIRTTPIDFDETDPQPWTIRCARHEIHAAAQDDARPARAEQPGRSIYSPDRLLYPMKRVDFDPKGERNPQNRGKSEYVRISWDGGARPRRRRDQTREARSRPGRHDRLARLASYLGPYRLLPQRLVPLQPTPSATRPCIIIRTAGKAGTGAPRTTGATPCASASVKLTAPSRICCKTARWSCSGRPIRKPPAAPMVRRKARCAGSG